MNTPRRHVALVGPRCSGKSTVGRALADLFGVPLVDLDSELVRAANATAGGETRFHAAGDVLTAWGEPTFRSLESQVLRDVLEERAPRVVATGGGVVLGARNRGLLARHARSVWLRVDPVELARRMRADPTPRPSLTGADPAVEIELVLAQRAPLYAEVSDLVLECGERGAGALALEIQKWLLQRKERGE